MRRHTLPLSLLPGEFVVCRFGPQEAIALCSGAKSDLYSITRTADELSVVCAAAEAPEGGRRETGWRCLRVRGPLPFSASGILASLAGPLAAAEIPIFALSTFDTDYVLVPESKLAQALIALQAAGHTIEPEP